MKKFIEQYFFELTTIIAIIAFGVFLFMFARLHTHSENQKEQAKIIMRAAETRKLTAEEFLMLDSNQRQVVLYLNSK